MKRTNKIRNISIGIMSSLVLMLIGVLSLYFSLSSKVKNNAPAIKGADNFKHFKWNNILIPIFDKNKIVTDSKELSREYKERKILGSVPVRLYKNTKGVYVMNDAQFAIFVNALESKLPYGPEIFGLKFININRESGHFFSPLEKYINLDIKEAPYTQTEKRPINYYDHYVATATHEYLHYLSKIYTVQLRESSSDTTKIYNLKGDALISSDSIPKPSTLLLNKNFLKEFKDQLGYNTDSLIDGSKDELDFKTWIWSEDNKTKVKEITLKNVATKYSVKWMWDRVNESPKVNLTVPAGEGKYVIGSKKFFDLFKYSKKQVSIFSKKQYYYYKFSELFARRFTFLLHKEADKFVSSTITISGSGTTSAPDHYYGKTSKDDFRYSQITPENKAGSSKWFADYVYGANDRKGTSTPYANRRSTKLYDALRKQMGQFNGSDVSWIKKGTQYTRRNWNVVKNGDILKSYIIDILNLILKARANGATIPQKVWDNIIKFQYITTSANNNKKLRMGGYLSKADIQTTLGTSLTSFTQKAGLKVKLGYKNDAGAIVDLNKSAKIHKYNVKKINSFKGNEYVELDDKEDKFFWILNNDDNKNFNFVDPNVKSNSAFDYAGDYISYDELEGKKLVLYKVGDTSKYLEIKTSRYSDGSSNVEFGKANTFVYDDLMSNQAKEYNVKEELGWAVIEESNIQ